MRINRHNRRRGSLTMEAVAVLPFVLILVLTTRFIVETMMTRQEVGVYRRGVAANAAAMDNTGIFGCRFEDSAFGTGGTADGAEQVDCYKQDGENGLSREQPMEQAMQNAANAWPGILAAFKNAHVGDDVRASGGGSVTFDGPVFMQNRGTQSFATGSVIMPVDDLWDHNETPWKNGHDRAIWQELRKQDTYKLFPNVFPARNR